MTAALDKLLYMAEQSLPIVHSPAPVQGGTAPVTLAGAMAMANAELLSALVVHQLKGTGAPFVYGFGMHHLDMKTTTSVLPVPPSSMSGTWTPILAGLAPVSGPGVSLPVVVVNTQENVYDKTISALEEVKARGASVIAVAYDDDTHIEHYTDHVLRIPRTLDLLSPVLSIVPLQLLAYHVADARGLEIDQPRNLAKSVTVE